VEIAPSRHLRTAAHRRETEQAYRIESSRTHTRARNFAAARARRAAPALLWLDAKGASMKLATFMLACGLALSGCYTSWVVRPGSLTPATANVAPADRSATWQRAIQVLLEEGYVPMAMNEAAGFVSGRQRDDVQLGTLTGATAIVTIAPDGWLRVEVAGAGYYTSEDDIVRECATRQQNLLRRILAAPSPAQAGG
jgi:hypothetical protein